MDVSVESSFMTESVKSVENWRASFSVVILLNIVSFSTVKSLFGPGLHDTIMIYDYFPSQIFFAVCVYVKSVAWKHGTYHAIDQSHRYGRTRAACREPAGSYDKTTRTAICFEHKTQYLLIRAPYTRSVVYWHISNIPPMISLSQISCNTPTFYIAEIFVKYCYTTGSCLL